MTINRRNIREAPLKHFIKLHDMPSIFQDLSAKKIHLSLYSYVLVLKIMR